MAAEISTTRPLSFLIVVIGRYIDISIMSSLSLYPRLTYSVPPSVNIAPHLHSLLSWVSRDSMVSPHLLHIHLLRMMILFDVVVIVLMPYDISSGKTYP